MNVYCLHNYYADIAKEIKLMSLGYYSAEFHPKRKKLKGWQKNNK